MNVPTDLGMVYISAHAWDRIDQHSITEQYARGLIADTDNWKQSDGRVVGWKRRDGVLWRVVLEPERSTRLDHDWDLITVVPEEVNRDDADRSGNWTPAEVLNLALYANQAVTKHDYT